MVEESAKQEIETIINQLLTENEIMNSSISADVEQSGSEVIINRILVSVTDDYNTEDVKNLILKNTGVVAEVKRIGE